MALKLNLQLFAVEENLTAKTDIEPAISIDFATRFTSNIKGLQEILGVTEMIPLTEGAQIKVYKTVKENSPSQAAEGDTIPLTKITRKVANTYELTLKKYRKAVSAEAIQTRGYKNAVNNTDDKLISEIQKEIKKDFFDLIATGSASATGTDFQSACANAWAKLQEIYEDEDATPVYFVNSQDVADYLGNAAITVQDKFGFTYVENFLNMGSAIVSPKITAGKVIATAKENLNGAYISATGSGLGTAFGLTSDETGFIGMTHTPSVDTATLNTLAMSCVKFFPERLDGIVVASFGE